MEYSTKDFYYKICEIIYLKKQTNLKLDQIEEVIVAYMQQPLPQKEKEGAEKDKPQPTKLQLKQWMDKHQVMAYLKIGTSTYYRYRRTGKLVPNRIFGEDRYLKDDVNKLLIDQ